MIKIGDLVIVKSNFSHIPELLGIVIDEDANGIWRYTVAECRTGDYIPCNDEELIPVDTPRQAEDWERKKKLRKLLDKNK